MSTETIEDSDYGSLTWDTKLAEWIGHAVMTDDARFQLFVATPADRQRPSVVATNPDKSITQESRIAFRSIRRGDAHIRAKVADEMLSLYSQWHDGEVISAEDFQARLKLDAVRVKATGAAKIYYLDDDMFYGHALIAHLLPNGSVRDVELFG